MVRVFALAVEAVAAPLDAYDTALQDITADPDHRDALRQLNECLDGVPKSGRLPHQAPVSWRIVPAVLATVTRTVRMAQETAEQSLQSIAHNPVYPPTPFEQRRNDRVMELQGNRNPFIDNLSWADDIWLGHPETASC